jgi:amidohydrolase
LVLWNARVITLGKIEVGKAYNIICKKIAIDGTVRSFNSEVRSFIKASILRKLKAVEATYGVERNAYYNEIGSILINSPEITEVYIKTAREFYGKGNVEILEKPSMGGEYFAEYLNKIPGNFIFIGVSKNKHTSYPWHHSNFNMDETALPKAAEYIAYTVREFLKQ